VINLPAWVPLWAAVYFSKETVDKYILNTWDAKTDESILISYKDATEWIKSLRFLYREDEESTIRDRCKDRLEKYIMPQMIKRGLIAI